MLLISIIYNENVWIYENADLNFLMKPYTENRVDFKAKSKVNDFRLRPFFPCCSDKIT